MELLVMKSAEHRSIDLGWILFN